MTTDNEPRVVVTQICTPERAAIHAAINVLTKPACAAIPLLETCEILARFEAEVRIATEDACRAREAELVEALAESLAALNAMAWQVEAEFRNQDRVADKHDKVVRSYREKVAALLLPRAKATTDATGEG